MHLFAPRHPVIRHTHRASGFSSVFVLGFAPPLPGDRAMTSPTTSSLRPTTKRGQPSAARWRGWYIKSRRFSRARSPRFDAIGLFWSGKGDYWRELFTNNGIMIVMMRVGYRRGWIIWVIRNGLMITVIDENDRWCKEFLHVGKNIYT